MRTALVPSRRIPGSALLTEIERRKAIIRAATLRLRYNDRPDSDVFVIYYVGTRFASLTAAARCALPSPGVASPSIPPLRSTTSAASPCSPESGRASPSTPWPASVQSPRRSLSLGRPPAPAVPRATGGSTAGRAADGRSRSLWLISNSSGWLIPPACPAWTGTFYFARRGTSHFAATQLDTLPCKNGTAGVGCARPSPRTYTDLGSLSKPVTSRTALAPFCKEAII